MFWIFLVGGYLHAGVVELGGSANYRSSTYDSNNYVHSLSYTASLTYFFSEMVAIEANYTNGYAKQVAKGPIDSDPEETIQDNNDIFGLDLVLAFGGRDGILRPYVKLGAGYLLKDRYLQLNDDDTNLISHEEGLVPSGGVGLAVALGKSFNVKVGVEAWSSPIKDKHTIIDYAGRAGLGVLF